MPQRKAPPQLSDEVPALLHYNINTKTFETLANSKAVETGFCRQGIYGFGSEFSILIPIGILALRKIFFPLLCSMNLIYFSIS